MALEGKRIAIMAEEDFEDAQLSEAIKAAHPAVPEPECNKTIIEALAARKVKIC